MTLYVTSHQERAFVEITPGVKTGFAVGSHVIHTNKCTINIIVISNSEYKYKHSFINFKLPIIVNVVGKTWDTGLYEYLHK